jgi:hypothetical protein
LDKVACNLHRRYVNVIFVIDVKAFEVTVRNWRPTTGRLWGVWLGSVVLFLVYSAVVAGTARAGAGEPSDPIAVVGNAAQQAATAQAADATATATQQQPANDVALTRTDSAGDDTITQENVDAAVAGGANDGSTSQNGAAGNAADQASTTDQTAGATAVATQNQPTNIVVIVRINSPGDDWISQTNTAVSDATAANTSVTKQGTPTAGEGAATSSGGNPSTGGAGTSGRDTPAPIGPPAQQEAAPPASTEPPAASPSREQRSTLVPLPAPVPPRTAAAPARRARDVPPAGGPALATAVRAGSVQAGVIRVLPSATSSSAAVGPPRHSAAPAARPARAHAVHSVRSSRGIGGRAADAFKFLAPRGPVPGTDAAASKDISRAVLITLLAVLAAGLLYAGSMYVPSPWRRLLDPRSRRRG